MYWRILSSLAFLVGGIFTWFLLGGLHGIAASQAGMSAVSGSRPSADALIPWFVCAYFFVSAVGIPFAKRQTALGLVAAVAHLLLFIGFFIICSEGSGDDAGKFWGGVAVLGILTVIVFSPWHAIWYCLLFMRKHDDAA